MSWVSCPYWGVREARRDLRAFSARAERKALTRPWTGDFAEEMRRIGSSGASKPFHRISTGH